MVELLVFTSVSDEVEEIPQMVLVMSVDSFVLCSIGHEEKVLVPVNVKVATVSMHSLWHYKIGSVKNRVVY